MFTPDERRALLFLALIAVVGGALRLVRSGPGPPGASVAPHLTGGDVVRQAALSQQAQELARPLAPGEKVDLDRAGVAELERLPRIGPQLARRIVAEREARGAFGSLGALDARVSGVGPALVRELERWTSFSGQLSPVTGHQSPVSGQRSPVTGTPGCRRDARIDPNTAGAAELACLPGLGPVLAERIVADREQRGPFAQVTDLERVPGLGAARVRRLTPHLSLP